MIRGIEITTRLSFNLIIKYLRMAEALLFSLVEGWHDAVAETGGGTMRSKKWYALPSSKRGSNCADLRQPKARTGAALRNARKIYKAALKTTGSAALQSLEDELQTSTARTSIRYAVHAHLTNQHAHRAVLAWQVNSGKGVTK